MNKLDASQESPLDNLIYAGTTRLLPAFRATGHTPNVITTYSFLCGMLSVVALWYERVTWFAFFVFLSYFFDCMDGQYARRYGMSSQFGDLYDHITDVIVYLALIAVVLQRRAHAITPAVVAIYVTLGVLMLISLGCQQRHKPGHLDNETLDHTTPLCRHKEWIGWTRFVGPATFNLATVLLVIHLFRQTPPGE